MNKTRLKLFIWLLVAGDNTQQRRVSSFHLFQQKKYMSLWKLKAIIQKTISFLPYNHKVNYLFQKHITKGVHLTDELLEDKLLHCSHHLKAFEQFAMPKAQLNEVVELGTGWFPIVPIGLYLIGAKHITTVDLTPLLRIDNVQTTLKKIVEYYENGKLQTFLPNIKKERWTTFCEIAKQAENAQHCEAILEALHITPLVADARNLPFKDASIDFITSNNTFEHIYEPILLDILREFRRISHAETLMSHFIDMSDHFAHLDKKITIFNFLKFSEKQWQIIDNTIQPQNRLRINKHRLLLEKTGFELLDEQNRIGNLSDLQSINLADCFANFSTDDILVTHSLQICKSK